MEREGFARRRERGEGVAGAGRGAGERSEAGRGDSARSATLANGVSPRTHRSHNVRASRLTFGGEAEAVTRAALARDFEHDGRERRGLCRRKGV